jgi:hypothetical protein
MSGRTSTSAVNVRSPPYSLLVTSISGCPRGLADDLVEHGLLVDLRLQQLHRHLARAEARHPDGLGQLLEGLVEVALQFGEGHLHVDANPGRAQLLDGALHCIAPCMSVFI